PRHVAVSPAQPGLSYHRTHEDPHYWRAFGRTPLAAVPRESLVPGTYWPDATTAGVLPGTQFAQVEAGSGGYITLDTENATYENVEFWGEVRCRAPGITFRNCMFRGKDPDTLTSNLHGCIKSYGPG